MKSLAIVGSHPDTREQAPFDNPDFDIWVFNEAAQAPWCKRWDVCFQLHIPEVYMSPNNYSNKEHWDWLQQDHGKKVIYMQDYDELVPNSRPYPLEAIKELLPGAVIHLAGEEVTWIDSTPSYALILALYLGYRDIHCWGIELSSNTEYYRQLPNWMYWHGVAAGMGVNVVMHSGQLHYKFPLYGYQGELQLQKDYYKDRMDNLDAAYQMAENTLRKLKDRLDNALLDNKHEAVIKLLGEMRNVAINAGQLAGAMSEAKKCYERPDPTPRQEMEKRAAQAQKDGDTKNGETYHHAGMTNYVYNVWRQTGDIGALNQLREFIRQTIQSAYDTGALSGIYKENLEYMTELDKLTNAAGGEKTQAALNLAR